MTKRNHKILAGLAALVTILIGCGSPEPELSTISQDTQALYGASTYDSSTCSSTSIQRFIKHTMFYGRTIAKTNAFLLCLTEAVDKRYKPCKGRDPFATASKSNQINEALIQAVGLSDINFRCLHFTDGLAKAGVGTFPGAGREDVDLGQWFWNQMVRGNQPVCSGAPNSYCRESDGMSWPTRQGSGVMWHEAMHNHGYEHADGNGEWCGYAAEDGYDKFTNSMPYIVGGCIDEMLYVSNQRCGNIEAGCAPGQLKLFEDARCQCISDTKQHPTPLSATDCQSRTSCDGETLSITCNKPATTDSGLVYVFEAMESDGRVREIGRSNPPYPTGFPTANDKRTTAGVYSYRVCRENDAGRTCGLTINVTTTGTDTCPLPDPDPGCWHCLPKPSGGKICDFHCPSYP